MRTRHKRWWLLCVPLWGLASCDSQVSPDYPGQPLVSLTGQVTSSSTLPLGQLEVALLWQRGPPPTTGDEQLATKAAVQGEFPAQFVLHLYHPPPAAALQSLQPGEVSFARANAAVLSEGAAQDASELPTSTFGNVSAGAYALDALHWFLFLEQAVPADSLTEWWLGGALPAGYHLLNVLATSPACLQPAQVASCVALLQERGVPDVPPGAGEATGYCTATYRLQPASFAEGITLQIGGTLTPTVAGCP
ncbi:MAG: hypothetical protein ACLPM8_02990 [Myxococcaceae bacterium]